MPKKSKKAHQRKWLSFIGGGFVIIISLVIFFVVLRLLTTRKSPQDIRRSCNFGVSVMQCQNGDYIVGTNQISIDGTSSVYNRHGFLISYSGGWGNSGKTLLYYLRSFRRKYLKNESYSSKEECKKLCTWMEKKN